MKTISIHDKDKPENVKRIILTEEIESHDGYWADWQCDIEMTDGSMKFGSIQSDGHCHAWDTLEIEGDL